MTNPGNGRNEVNGNPRNFTGSSKQEQSIDDVMDAFNNIARTAGSGAILASDWKSSSLGDQGRDARRTRGNTRAHSEIDSDNFSADEKVKGPPNRSQWVNTAGFHEDSNGRGKSWRNEDNDGRIYTTNNIRNHDTPGDYYASNGGYRDSNASTNTSRLGGTDNYTNNNHASNTHDHIPSNEDNVINCDEHPTHLTPLSIAPQKDLDGDEDVATKISAWHSLADPKAKERGDGVGTGQLHRKGRNFRPVDEKTVLEIQQRGKIIRKTKRSREDLRDKSHSPTKSGSLPRGVSPKSLDKTNPLPKHGASLLNPPHSEPTVQRKQPVPQRQSPPSPSPPSSSPQAELPQQNAPERDHHNVQTKLDSWESPRNSPQKLQTTMKPPQKPQYYHRQSPAHSQEECLPYIPPEFDSTPYRKQPSPLPVDLRRGRVNNDYEGQRDYDQSSDATTEYYEDSENDEATTLLGSATDPPILGGDRGELLLTINVELQEGEGNLPIFVYMRDDPSDLAREFCAKWKVTNDVIEPALTELIKDEKEKRLG